MKAYVRRHQPSANAATVLKAGLGGAVAIGIVALLSDASGVMWLMAPFGATCVAVQCARQSVVAACQCGRRTRHLDPDRFDRADDASVAWWSMALGVGLAITAMAALRITHPPAGADPLVVMMAGAGGGVGFDFCCSQL